MCRETALCYVDSKAQTSNDVDDALEVVHAIYSKVHRRLRFYCFEFTVPKDLQSKIGMDGGPVMKRIAQETWEEYYGGDVQLGMSLAFHYWHSSNPLLGFYPHVHGTLFDFGVGKKSGELIPFTRGVVDVARLRRIYRRRLEARFGVSADKDVNLHVHYSTGYGHLRHRLAYQYRAFVQDAYRYVAMAAPELADADWLRKALFRGRERRVSQCGWFNHRNLSPMSRFMRLLGLSLPKKAVRDKERQRVWCPTCGCEMTVMERYGHLSLQAVLDGGYRILRLSGDAGFVGWGG